MNLTATISLPPERSPGRLYYPPIQPVPGLLTSAMCSSSR